jgi:uncharacterized 2Fe-2S/4Fe-4S cluster protein (DUF4445 family)
LIGGFVGSDALACLAYYGFDRASAPMAAIDLGTNGEVLVTDGQRILVTSTAAGPAFEGVNISCGTRAVDGAIVQAQVGAADGSLVMRTIADRPPVGLTGSGLLDLVSALRQAGAIDRTGRLDPDHPHFCSRIDQDSTGVRRLLLTDQGVHRQGFGENEQVSNVSLFLTQNDIRELQKAKAAVRAAADTLLARLDLQPSDLQRMILTGSFGSQLNVAAVVGLGMIPPVRQEVVETSANGAGLGAALFSRGEQIAAQAEQVELDTDPDFIARFIQALELPEPSP